jgi:dipeptide/tripeptide permease
VADRTVTPMTPVTPETQHADDQQPERPERASLWKVVRDQRKTVVVALVLSIAAFWVLGQMDQWRLAAALAIGVGLGLVNHLATERWLLGLITSGAEPTRAVMIRSTMVRLVVLTVVAVLVAVLFWPDGIGVLLGLAVFRLIALVMTTIPLLKELKEQ